MNRSRRAEVAAETDEIVARGAYAVGGREVAIGEAAAAAIAGTHIHLPDDPGLVAPPAGGRAGRIVVTGETTLAAARRLTAEGPDLVACLNFASAKQPGGGYRSGAEAQEESLARASALATCLEAVPEYYEHHRRQADPLYTDRIICSPAVPIFRYDDGSLLPEPYTATFLTAAAPNAGALADRGWTGDIKPVFTQRARRVLAAGALHGHRRVVLGAWGCGVFRNDPHLVATTFAELLQGDFATTFDEVTFAVLDNASGAPTRGAFAQQLG